MKPKQSGLILEGDRDRRYARKGALLIGQPDTASHIDQLAKAEYNRLLRGTRLSVTDQDVRDAYWHAFAMHEPHMMWNSGTLRAEIAEDRATDALGNADLDVEEEHVPVIVEGLEAIAGLTRTAAMRHMVVRPAAEAMLAQLGVARPRN